MIQVAAGLIQVAACLIEVPADLMQEASCLIQVAAGLTQMTAGLTKLLVLCCTCKTADLEKVTAGQHLHDLLQVMNCFIQVKPIQATVLMVRCKKQKMIY
jgi:hypothetical protein